MQLGSDDLVLAHWTMASASFEQRCAAAAAGGFAGIGILPGVYTDARATGLTDADLAAMMGSYGLRLAELESLSVAGPESEAEIDGALAVHWHLSERFGADRLGIVVRPGHPPDYQLERFRRICDDAAQRSVRVGIEFIRGVAAFEDVESTMAFVTRVERDNAGLIVDCYHHFRRTDDLYRLEELSGDRIVMIQLSDAAVPPQDPDYVTDTMHNRRPPGEGDFALASFVRAMDAIGSTAPWSVEVLSDELGALTPEEQGLRLGGAARAVLAAARSHPI